MEEGREGRREEKEGKREGAVKRKDEGEGEERRERAAREKVRKGRLLQYAEIHNDS